jgi:hypothetical protein
MKQPRQMFGKTLTYKQWDGVACVVCGADHGAKPEPAVPVGMIDGGQVFACESCAKTLR